MLRLFKPVKAIFVQDVTASIAKKIAHQFKRTCKIIIKCRSTKHKFSFEKEQARFEIQDWDLFKSLLKKWLDQEFILHYQVSSKRQRIEIIDAIVEKLINFAELRNPAKKLSIERTRPINLYHRQHYYNTSKITLTLPGKMYVQALLYADLEGVKTASVVHRL